MKEPFGNFYSLLVDSVNFAWQVEKLYQANPLWPLEALLKANIINYVF